MYNKNLYNKIINSISKVVKQQINEAFDFSNISDNKSKQIIDTYNQAWVQEYIDRLIAKDNTLMEDDNFIKMLRTKTPLYKAKSKEDIRAIYEGGLKVVGTRFPLRFIDVSGITDMSEAFRYLEDAEFCGIENWDVSNVIDMSKMFANCTNFSGDVRNWDVSNVENMSGMFNACKMFDGQGLENWDVSNVKNMSGMFNACTWLNIDFSKWDVSNVTDMHTMFRLCSHFTGFGLNTWNISNVDNMLEMFYGDIAIKKQYIENWDPIAIAKKPIYDRLTATSNMFSKSSIQKSTPKWYKKLCKD